MVLIVYYFFIGGLYFNELIAFVIIHVFTYYFKKKIDTLDNDKKGKIGLIICLFGVMTWIAAALLLNFIGLRIPSIGSRFNNYNKFFNPIILAIAYGSVILASSKNYYNGVVNKLSKYSLLLYIFTGNQLIRKYFDTFTYSLVVARFNDSMRVCFLYIMIYSLIKILIGLIVSFIYDYLFNMLEDKVKGHVIIK